MSKLSDLHPTINGLLIAAVCFFLACARCDDLKLSNLQDQRLDLQRENIEAIEDHLTFLDSINGVEY